MGSGRWQRSAELLVAHEGFVVPTSWNALTGDLAGPRSPHLRDLDPQRRWQDSAIYWRARQKAIRTGFHQTESGSLSSATSTGDYQVYVTAYPGPARLTVSTNGGLSPIWSVDDRELFFRLGTKMLAARMSSGPTLDFSVPVELFDGPYTLDLMGHQREDVAVDRRFLMVENSDDFPIVIVQNWPLELGRVVR